MLNVQAEGDGMVEGRAKSLKAQVLLDVEGVSTNPTKTKGEGEGVEGLGVEGCRL